MEGSIILQAFSPKPGTGLGRAQGTCGLRVPLAAPNTGQSAGEAPGFYTALSVDVATAVDPAGPLRWLGLHGDLRAAAAALLDGDAAATPGGAQEGAGAPGSAAASSARPLPPGFQAVTAHLQRGRRGGDEGWVLVTLQLPPGAPAKGRGTLVTVERLPPWLSLRMSDDASATLPVSFPVEVTTVTVPVRIHDRLLTPHDSNLRLSLGPDGEPCSSLEIPLLWWAPLLTRMPIVPNGDKRECSTGPLRPATALLGPGWAAFPVPKEQAQAVGLPVPPSVTYVAFAKGLLGDGAPGDGGEGSGADEGEEGVGEAEPGEGEEEDEDEDEAVAAAERAAASDEEKAVAALKALSLGDTKISSHPLYPMLRLVTFNINGLTSLELLERSIFSFHLGLAPLPDVICLQEVRCSERASELKKKDLEALVTRMDGRGYSHVRAGQLMILWNRHTMERIATGKGATQPDLVWSPEDPQGGGDSQPPPLEAAWGEGTEFSNAFQETFEAIGAAVGFYRGTTDTAKDKDLRQTHSDQSFFCYPPITVVLRHKETRTAYVITTAHTPGTQTDFSRTQLQREVEWLMDIQRYSAVIRQLTAPAPGGDEGLRRLAQTRGPRRNSLVPSLYVNKLLRTATPVVHLVAGDFNTQLYPAAMPCLADWRGIKGSLGYEPSTAKNHADAVYIARGSCARPQSRRRNLSDARLFVTTFAVLPSELLVPRGRTLHTGSDHKPVLVEMREAGVGPEPQERGGVVSMLASVSRMLEAAMASGACTPAAVEHLRMAMETLGGKAGVEPNGGAGP
ncbi:hypothetical protein HYH03_003439 [Edaphochlamys debaryana]|uniref:Endonuclease/exonuclease/phosphatase domain-containing protein n=1 Tax=Edaphochlamys debaryana TaxID=47281 RepID=A0A836C4F2_9CHLO|nr:hypothetical protein HYH03_003439 [Edaphochlamys debaryana]|eukprot:KAG2498699.1 hypothetical protein HYH03_003439 [Edaphochlamys debaryana]